MIKNFFLALYTLYLLTFLDSLQLVHVIRFSHTGIYVIYFLLLVGLVLLGAMGNNIKLFSEGHLIIGLFVLYYFLMLLHFRHSNYYSVFVSLLMLAIIFLNYKLIIMMDCLVEFIMISIVITSLFFSIVCHNKEINLVTELGNVNFLNMLAGDDRYRIDFGFYNVNGAGNLVSNLLCLSRIVSHRLKNSSFINCSRIVTFMRFIEIMVCDTYLLVILMLTNSRNGIITVAICYFIIIYYKVATTGNITDITRGILKAGISLIVAIFAFLEVIPVLISMAKTSNRLVGWQTNIKAISSPIDFAFGVGQIIVPKGDFFEGLHLAAMDNYYLYIFICGGVFGAIIILIALLKTGISIYSRTVESGYFCRLFAIYVALLLSGMGENCVMNSVFPSCIILWSVFFSSIERGEPTILVES